MNRQQLVEVMLYQMGAFNRTGIPVTEATVHASVLTDEGAGTATPQRIYKAFVRASFSLNGASEPSWPPDWTTMSVGALADRLIGSIEQS